MLFINTFQKRGIGISTNLERQQYVNRNFTLINMQILEQSRQSVDLSTKRPVSGFGFVRRNIVVDDYSYTNGETS